MGRYFLLILLLFFIPLAVANFTTVSSDTTLVEGHNLQLFCIASGRPAPNITFVRIFPDGSESDVLHRGATWDLINISRTDAGTYRCTANNGVGNPVNHTLRVNVQCEYTTEDRLVLVERFFLSLPLVFFRVCSPKGGWWSLAFLAETMETGEKNRDSTDNIKKLSSAPCISAFFFWTKLRKDFCKRRRAFPERVGPRILSLERVDYFGTSEYFSSRKR